MLYCKKCGYYFERPVTVYEKHGFSHPPYEKSLACPSCGGNDFSERITTHCRCCGSKLGKADEEYCSQGCRERGEKLWKREQKRKKLEFENPINVIIRELMQYNHTRGTDYSYGQYVALKAMEGKKAKCKKKRKNT